MRFVLSFIKVLKISRLFRQDQDQDFFFKTKTIFHVLEAPRDQDQGLETTSLLLSTADKHTQATFNQLLTMTASFVPILTVH